jgi:repressor LexA
VQLAVEHLTSAPRIPLSGIVAAGDPIEPIPQTEVVEVPPGMVGRGETYALKVKVKVCGMRVSCRGISSRQTTINRTKRADRDCAGKQ